MSTDEQKSSPRPAERARTDVSPDFFTIPVTDELSHLLCSASSSNFFVSQHDRFEVVTPGADPADPKFDGGTMSWCTTGADTLIMNGRELHYGYDTVVLWDLDRAVTQLPNGAWADAHVVLSSRKFDTSGR